MTGFSQPVEFMLRPALDRTWESALARTDAYDHSALQGLAAELPDRDDELGTLETWPTVRSSLSP